MKLFFFIYLFFQLFIYSSFSFSSSSSSSSNENYPFNSLINPGNIFPFYGIPPISRIRHTVEVINSFIIIYGGITDNNNDNNNNNNNTKILLDDLNIYDLRTRKWSGTITRLECCNEIEEVINTLGTSLNVPVSKLQSSFQGSIPPARADHGSAVIQDYNYNYGNGDGNGENYNDLMFIFGGLSSFGYLNDFYHFSITNLKWTKISNTLTSSWPCRRAGHSMVSYLNNIYIFGGRTILLDKSLAVLNDIWKYDFKLNTWTKYPVLSNELPQGRQYTGTTIHYNQLWIFGGIDSTIGYTFNDLWSYDLTLHKWTQRSLNSGKLNGFIPPPLHHVHLIPSPFNNNIPSLLIYGGISSGGSCGNKLCQPTNRTFYGQLYRYTFNYEILNPSQVNNVDNIFIDTRSTIQINDGKWEYSRIQSNHEFESGGSGKYLKRYGLESIGYNRQKGTLYEFSGINYIDKDLELTSSSSSTSSPSSSSLQGINKYNFPLPNTKSGEGRNINDGGGRLYQEYWDLYTNEQLRNNVDFPTVSNWWYDEYLQYNQTIKSINNELLYRNELYEYSVNGMDFVLVSRENELYV